jgi:hypothetical protein
LRQSLHHAHVIIPMLMKGCLAWCKKLAQGREGSQAIFTRPQDSTTVVSTYTNHIYNSCFIQFTMSSSKAEQSEEQYQMTKQDVNTDTLPSSHLVYTYHENGFARFHMSTKGNKESDLAPGWRIVNPEDMVMLDTNLFATKEQADLEKQLWTNFNVHMQETTDKQASLQTEDTENQLHGLDNYLKTVMSSAVDRCRQSRKDLSELVHCDFIGKEGSEISYCYSEAVGAGIQVALNKAMLRCYQSSLRLPWMYEGGPKFSSKMTTNVADNARRLAGALERHTRLKEILHTYWDTTGSFPNTADSPYSILKQLNAEEAREYRYIGRDLGGHTSHKQEGYSVLGSQLTIPKFGYSAKRPVGDRLRVRCSPSIAFAPGSCKTLPNIYPVEARTEPNHKGEVIFEDFEQEYFSPRVEDGISLAAELRQELLTALTEAETALTQWQVRKDQVTSGFSHATHDSEIQLDNLIRFYTEKSQVYQTYSAFRQFPGIWNKSCQAYTRQSNQLHAQQAQLRDTEPDVAVYGKRWLDLACARSDPEFVASLSKYELDRVFANHPSDNFGSGVARAKAKEVLRERDDTRHEERQMIYQKSLHKQEASLQQFQTAMEDKFGMREIPSTFEEYIDTVRTALGRGQTAVTSKQRTSTNVMKPTFTPGRFVCQPENTSIGQLVSGNGTIQRPETIKSLPDPETVYHWKGSWRTYQLLTAKEVLGSWRRAAMWRRLSMATYTLPKSSHYDERLEWNPRPSGPKDDDRDLDLRTELTSYHNTHAECGVGMGGEITRDGPGVPERMDDIV